MRNVFDNLINGNLTDAKRLAKRHTGKALCHYATESLGWPFAKAVAASGYLKGALTFQAYCDAK